MYAKTKIGSPAQLAGSQSHVETAINCYQYIVYKGLTDRQTDRLVLFSCSVVISTVCVLSPLVSTVLLGTLYDVECGRLFSGL